MRYKHNYYHAIVGGAVNSVAHMQYGIGGRDMWPPVSSSRPLFLRGWYNPCEYHIDRPAWLLHGGIDFPCTMSDAVGLASHLLRSDWWRYREGISRRELLYVDVCRSIGGHGVAFSVVACVIPNTWPLEGGVLVVSEAEAFRFFDDELVPTVYGGRRD